MVPGYAVLERQAAAGAHLHLETARQLHAQARRDKGAGTGSECYGLAEECPHVHAR